jgi:hypothetical protein
MDRVRRLAAAGALSRRRAMKLRAPRSGDMLLYAWLVVVVVVRFTQNCALAVRELGRGNHAVGLVLTEFCMLHFLLAVFLVTFLSALLSHGASILDRRRLALAGVPFAPLLCAELAGLATHPLSWAAFLFVLPAAAPLALLPHPALAILSLCACFAALLLLASGLAHALSLSRAARAASGAFRMLFAAGLFFLVLANFDFDWKAGPVRLFLFQHPLPLADATGGGPISWIRPGSPSAWIFQGRLAACAALAAACLLLYGLCIRHVYAKAGEPEPPHRGRTRAPARAATIPGLLYRHELARLATAPATAVGVAAGLGSALWLLLTPHPTAGIPALGCAIALLAAFPFAVNIFGHDGKALRRYALLYPDWRVVFGSKNGAWLTVMAAAMAAPMAAAAARIGPAAGVSLLLCGTAVLSTGVLWGNLGSLLLPSAVGPGQRTAFINQAAPFLLCGLPLMLHRTVGAFGSGVFDAALAACTAAAAALYGVFLRRLARTFDAEVGDVLERF